MKYILSILVALVLIFSSFIKSQDKNKGIFVEPQPGFYQEIEKGISEFKNGTYILDSTKI